MAGRWRWVLAVAAALGAVGCSGDDDSSPPTSAVTGAELSIDALTTAGSQACPLPLTEAATAGGLDGGVAGGTVDTAPVDTTAPTGNTLDLPVLQRLDGVSVSCTFTGDEATVDVVLIAGRLDVAGSAALALVPALSREAALTADELAPIAEELPSLELGSLADLPGDAAVAVVRTSISGAADAAVLVSSADLDRVQVEAIATALDRLLR